jgi:cytochrome c556
MRGILILTFLCALLVGFGAASTVSAHIRTVHEAQHAVDQAWEAFHQAALGGTLASPDVQSQIEQDLHEARGLLVKAREAAKRKAPQELDGLLKRIEELSVRVIAASRGGKP